MRPRAEMTAPAAGGGYAPYPCWAGGMSGVGTPVFGAGLAWAAPGCGCGYAAVCSSGAGCGGVPGAGGCVVSVGSGGPEPLCVAGPLGGAWSPVRGGSFGGADTASRWLVPRWAGLSSAVLSVCSWGYSFAMFSSITPLRRGEGILKLAISREFPLPPILTACAIRGIRTG